VEASLQRRGDAAKITLLHDIIAKDNEWRALLAKVDSLRNKRNLLTKKIDETRLSGGDFKAIVEEARKIAEEIKEEDVALQALRDGIDKSLLALPNILHETVPEGRSEEDNVEVRRWGSPKKPDFDLKHHGEFAVNLGLADFERAVKISGTGFYILKGALALMDLALMRFAVDYLAKKGYILIEPPFLMRRKPYEGVTDMADFESVMYKIDNEDLYLIATSEHAIGGMHMNEIFEEKQLPLKYCGISACFRREIGKHGLDERGLFRVHQFNKIEQFIYCKPEDSWKLHEELISNAEEITKKLEIPYRIVNVCTGDIGTVAAKKYDLEGWSPREGKYIELMSCSNCTTYQSARLNIKYASKGRKEYVHTLNSTEIATARMIRLILENYQTKKGVLKVPDALRSYMNGIREIKPAT
ncbi:MAG: serine--tRNA ligase, partial [Candidatus Altiarchaeales archaeon]|nr:serine--tRNA ligase [Candidatus Altiarchaeales archaeon]